MCYGTTRIESSLSWRLPFIILSAYSLCFTALAITLLPDSPRWLTLRGRGNEAGAVWEKLGIAPADREKIVLDMEQSNSSEVAGTSAHSSQQVIVDEKTGQIVPAPPGTAVKPKVTDMPRQTTLIEAFCSPETRPQLLFALFIMGMQQMSGIDGVLFVSLGCPIANTRNNY